MSRLASHGEIHAVSEILCFRARKSRSLRQFLEQQEIISVELRNEHGVRFALSESQPSSSMGIMRYYLHFHAQLVDCAVKDEEESPEDSNVHSVESEGDGNGSTRPTRLRETSSSRPKFSRNTDVVGISASSEVALFIHF